MIPNEDYLINRYNRVPQVLDHCAIGYSSSKSGDCVQFSVPDPHAIEEDTQCSSKETHTGTAEYDSAKQYHSRLELNEKNGGNKSRFRVSVVEKRQDHYDDEVETRDTTDERESAVSAHSRVSSVAEFKNEHIVVRDYFSCAIHEGTADDRSLSNDNNFITTTAIQIFERLKATTNQLMSIPDDGLKEALLQRHTREGNGHQPALSIEHSTDPLVPRDGDAVAAETAIHVSQFDFIGSLSGCLETLADIGYHLCGMSLGNAEVTAIGDEHLDCVGTKSIVPIQDDGSDILVRQDVSDSRRNDIWWSYLGSQKKGIHINRETIVADETGTPSVEVNRLNADSNSHRGSAWTPKTEPILDLSCDPEVTSVANGQDELPRENAQFQLVETNPHPLKRKHGRVLQRAYVRCYMAWCSLRNQISRPITSSHSQDTESRCRGRPEWVHVPHDDTLDRLVGAIETNGQEEYGAVKWRPWVRPPTLPRAPLHSLVSQMTSHAESSSLGIFMAETRLEI